MSLTHRDHNQIVAAEHSELDNAKRVIIVGGEMPEFKLGDIKFPETQVQKIEVPVIVKETQIVEVPTIIKEVEIIRVEVPIIVKEIVEVIKEIPIIQTKVELIEKPIIITQIEHKDLPIWIKICLVAQILISIISSLKMIK